MLLFGKSNQLANGNLFYKLPMREWSRGSKNYFSYKIFLFAARLKNDSLKHLIQLVKAWKYYQDVPLLSFYLELRVTKYAEVKTSIVYDIDLARILKYLLDVQLARMRDPMGVSGLINASKCLVANAKCEAVSIMIFCFSIEIR